MVQYNLSNPAPYQTEKKIRIRQGTGIERLTYPCDFKVTLISIGRHPYNLNKQYARAYLSQGNQAIIACMLPTCMQFLSGSGWGHMLENLIKNLRTPLELKDEVHQNLEVLEYLNAFEKFRYSQVVIVTSPIF